MRRMILISVLIPNVCLASAIELCSRPAERARGLSWCGNFSSQQLVENDSGTIHGSPTFSYKEGVTLDGSSDYIQYHLTGQEFFNSELSILVEFTPEFAADEDLYRYFYDADTGGAGRCYLYKLNNAGGNKLIIGFGNTGVDSVDFSTYSPYWLQGQRNILIVSATSGDTDAWLNGHQITTNDTTAWTADTPTALHVGSSFEGKLPFPGTIHRFVVFHAKLSDAECEAYSNGTMWTYESRAVAVWRFRAADHTGTTTKESAGRGYDLTINGSPEKLQTHGYEFDGSNDYLSRADDDTFDPSGDFSVQCVMKINESSASPYTIFSTYFPGVTAGFNIDYRAAAEQSFFVIASSSGATSCAYTCSGCTYDYLFGTWSYEYVSDGTSIADIYIGTTTGAECTNMKGPVNGTSKNTALGSRSDTSFKFKGQILYCAYFNEALNQMQHLDFMIRERRKIQEQ